MTTKTKKSPAKKKVLSFEDFTQETFKKIYNVDFEDPFDQRFYPVLLEDHMNNSKFLADIPEDFINRYEDETTVYHVSVTTVLSATMKNKVIDDWRVLVGKAEAERRLEAGAYRGSIIHQAIDILNKRGRVQFRDERREEAMMPHINHDAKWKAEIANFKKKGITLYIVKNREAMRQVASFLQIIKILKLKSSDFKLTEQNVSTWSYGRYAGTLDGVLNIAKGVYPISSDRQGSMDKFEGGLYLNDIKTGRYFPVEYTGMQLSAYRACFPKQYQDQIRGAIGIHLGDTKSKTGLFGVKLYHYSKADLDFYFELFLHHLAIFQKSPLISIKPARYTFPEALYREDLFDEKVKKSTIKATKSRKRKFVKKVKK